MKDILIGLGLYAFALVVWYFHPFRTGRRRKSGGNQYTSSQYPLILSIFCSSLFCCCIEATIENSIATSAATAIISSAVIMLFLFIFYVIYSIYRNIIVLFIKFYSYKLAIGVNACYTSTSTTHCII